MDDNNYVPPSIILSFLPDVMSETVKGHIFSGVESFAILIQSLCHGEPKFRLQRIQWAS